MVAPLILISVLLPNCSAPDATREPIARPEQEDRGGVSGYWSGGSQQSKRIYVWVEFVLQTVGKKEGTYIDYNGQSSEAVCELMASTWNNNPLNEYTEVTCKDGAFDITAGAGVGPMTLYATDKYNSPRPVPLGGHVIVAQASIGEEGLKIWRTN
jgi:hypothetical protein